MFQIALVIGIYSYLIFFLGILGILYKDVIIFSTLFYFIIVGFYLFKIKKFRVGFSEKLKLSRISKLLLFIIFFQGSVNLIGALGPELSFDALWYHLTIPKIFLENHKIFHIPGNLLYYSDMPKLIEMLYLSALTISNEISTKLIHYTFGLLSVIALYKLSRKFLNREMSLLSCIIFYSNLVVGWQSITAYIDLGRTFFEIVALYELINWIQKKNQKYLIYSAVAIGFSISTKLSALSSLGIFLILIFLIDIYSKSNFKPKIKNIFYFIFFSLLIPMPFLIVAFLNTGNPFFPVFESSFQLAHDRNIFNIIKLFLFSSDPINPVYLIFIPVIILFFRKFDFQTKILVYYSSFSLLFWLLISSFGGSRFILPYLPAFSILVALSISMFKMINFRRYLLLLIILVSLSSIGYRFLANYKYIPVILGTESKQEFLSNNLNFSFGDFYDTDGYFKKNIKSSDIVLLYGFHNLYYVNFPFIDSSWVKKGDEFNYIAVQDTSIPKKFSDWKEIYYNSKTMVKLYSKEGKVWVY